MADFYGLIIIILLLKTVTKKCDIFDFEQPVFLPVFTYMYSPFIKFSVSCYTRFTSLAFCCGHCSQVSSSLTLFAYCELYQDHPPLVLLGCC